MRMWNSELRATRGASIRAIHGAAPRHVSRACEQRGDGLVVAGQAAGTCRNWPGSCQAGIDRLELGARHL